MPASPDDLFRRLESLEITTTTVEHPPLFTVEESRALRGKIPGGHSKNLFLKCKKGQLWLVVALETARIDLKSLHKRIGAAHLSFGRPELLEQALGVPAGSVTPFALINDAEQRLRVVLDDAMMRLERLNFHPLVNTATTTIGREDLLAFIRSCGHEPAVMCISDEGGAGEDQTSEARRP